MIITYGVQHDKLQFYKNMMLPLKMRNILTINDKVQQYLRGEYSNYKW